MEVPFLGHSGFYTTNEATPPAPAALAVNELSPEICGLIKRQKRGWEAIGLTELVTIAEHFERTLDRDHKQRSAKRMAAQLQQFGARDPSNTWTSHIISSRGKSLSQGPMPLYNQLGHWRKDCLPRSYANSSVSPGKSPQMGSSQN